MADKKISQLTALSAANLAPSTDVLAIVDTSATETKKIVAQDLINGVLNVASAVGIGTASPGAKLTIAQSSNAITQGLLLINAAGTQNGGWYHGGSALIGREGGFDTIALAAGNVGIGTASPAQKLDVTGGARFYSAGNWMQFGVNALESLNNDGGYIRAVISTASNPTYSWQGDQNTGIFTPAADTIGVTTGGTERMRLTSSVLFTDSSINVGIGTTSPTQKLEVVGGIASTGTDAFFAQRAVVPSGVDIGAPPLSWRFYTTGTTYTTGAMIQGLSAAAWSSTSAPMNMAFYTVPSGSTTMVERGRFTSGGSLLVNTQSDSGYQFKVLNANSTDNTSLAFFGLANGNGTHYFFNATGTGVNTAASAMWIEKNSTTSRSINAGGTVNASGADYAEYMTKAGEFALAKGDVCGINADGKLTNVFANAISFVVKSTDPSYVGGDSWGAEFKDNPEGLEAARQKVDRIAFAGQVPVNVLGATPGQYIVPVNNSGAIKGVAVSNPTFEQYQSAVGKVIAVQDDGRALIIVKVA